MLEIEKKESKTLNTFQKLLEQISKSRQYNQSRQGQSSRKNVEEANKNKLDISGNNYTGTIPNPLKKLYLEVIKLRSNIKQ